jgi:hypothetical protein
MELTKGNKTKVIKVLAQINRLRQADEAIWDLTDGWKKYFDQDQLRSAWFLDWYNTLDIVYLEMIGITREEADSYFKSCSYDKPDKPVAWYRTQFNSDKEIGPIPGPKKIHKEGKEKNYSGYIHDRIDDVILCKHLSAENKYKLLNTMFKDLIRLKREYNENRSQAAQAAR